MENIKITKKELAQDVDGMFQFVIMVSIFFLTFIDNLFKLANATPEQTGTVQIHWANVPIALVVGYVLFRIFRFKLKDWVIKTTNFLLFTEIISMVTAITVVLEYGNKLTSYLAYYTLQISLWSTISLSILIFLLLLLSTFIFREKN